MSNIHYFDAISNTGNLGDLEKTILVNKLMETDFEARDSKWIHDFLNAIDEANLKLGEPEIMMSSIGFPYFNLKTIQEGESFHAFVIKPRLPSILENGFGITINAQKENPDWIFTYGDIVNLQLNEEFYTDNHLFSKNSGDFAIGNEEKLIFGEPSIEILPEFLRKQIREYLEFNGVKSPKVMLIARNYEDEQNATQDLVFNITPTNFSNENEYHKAMNSIAWFLPRHYSIVGMLEEDFPEGFKPL